MRSGNFGAAAAAFERALAVARGGAIAEDAAYGRGVALARAGRTQDAKGAFRALLAAYPQSAHAAEVSTMLGWILYDEGHDAEAEQRFRAAIDAADAAVRASARAGLHALGKVTP
jgi:TolA-binding protein